MRLNTGMYFESGCSYSGLLPRLKQVWTCHTLCLCLSLSLLKLNTVRARRLSLKFKFSLILQNAEIILVVTV